ncbi:hypothetical protein KP509_12G007800 [Ceratopteris richardii]|uniref:RING-type E3 ubiquitin transferase n=1 Tax=Ceratopteris richardii TaxID=49495 RepID=A0A8T2TKS5_CERRI|nr:hypothetical protein KP509_12G007800 [Ceratopteris richardii]
MGEIMQQSHENEAQRIGVCIGRERRGLGALKWAIQKDFIKPNGHVYFLHVKPPLRWIPNPMGGKLPIDRVNPDIIKRFQEERFLETEKLFIDFKKLCNSKKITYELCYSENDSVQEELVKQISKLRITKLFLEKVSKNSFFGALGTQNSISAYVAENATLCKVIVIRKNKLFSVSEGQSSEPDLSLSMASDTTSDSARSETSESDVYTTTGSILNEETGMQSEEQDEQCSPCFRSASMDVSRKPSEWLRHDDDLSAVPQRTAMVENISRLPFSKRHYSSMDAKFTLAGLNSTLSNASLGQSSPSTASLKDSECVVTQSAGTDRKNFDASTSGSLPSYNSDVYSELSLETDNLTETSMLEALSSQNPLHEMENVQKDFNPILGSDELTEAKQSTLQWVQREAEHRANHLQVAEKVIETAQKQISELEMQRNAALNEAKMASYKTFLYQKQNEELAAKVQAALGEKETLQKELHEEIRRHTATRNELEVARRMAEDSAMKAEIYEHEYRTEKCRSEQLKLELEKQTKEWERECHLRKEAEGKVSHGDNVITELASTNEQNMYSEFSYEQIQASTSNFAEENKLGQGGYGPVYKGELQHIAVAVKVLAREGVRGRAEFKREVDILRCLHHPHIVMLIGACPEKGCIVYEYMANGSLEDRLNCRGNTPPLPWFIRFRICVEVAIALLFLHSRPQPIVHRDLKPGNILLDHRFLSKISDVGLAKLVTNINIFSVTVYKETELVGTLPYMDPDYQRTGVISCESDVYSLGIVMLQLLTGKGPFGVAHVVEEALENGKLEEVLDKSAGEWPLKEASDFAHLSLQCVEPRRRHRPKLESHILPVIKSIQKIAGTAIANF